MLDDDHLKITDLKQQITRLQNKKYLLENLVNELQDQLYVMENILIREKSTYHGKKNFTKWEQLVSRRKEYKSYQARLNKIQNLPIQIEELKQRIEIEKQVAAVESASLQQEIDQLENEIVKLQKETMAEHELSAVPAHHRLSRLKEFSLPKKAAVVTDSQEYSI